MPRASTWLALSLLAGCVQPPPPAAPEIALLPAAPAPASRESPRIEVTSARAPERLAIDADLSEWGTWNDASTQIKVAFTGDSAIVAARLGETATDGIWLGIGSEPLRGPGPNGSTCDGPGTTPEANEACASMQEEYKAFLAKHDRLFERVYRIDSAGVRVLQRDGTLVAVPLAQVAWRKRAGGATAEASIPAASLPRFDRAPLDSIQILASDAPDPAKLDLLREHWTQISLDPPLAFEPWADLRARVLEVARGWQCDDSLSYQPGDPLHLLGAWSGAHPLYRKQASLGETEIGFALEGPTLCAMSGVPGPPFTRTAVAVLHRGHARSVLNLAKVMKIVERGGELHVIAYDDAYSSGEGWSHADWSVTAVTADGSVRENLLPTPKQPITPPQQDRRLTGVKVIHADDFTSFGLQKTLTIEEPNGQSKKLGFEIVWRWDPGKKAYVVKERRIPPP